MNQSAQTRLHYSVMLYSVTLRKQERSSHLLDATKNNISTPLTRSKSYREILDYYETMH
ncbi:hypothetical protein [Holospora curviuscula]|uniref:hypothetical protein n=1 Tax=Holospora curviuscula TaxID=1082868 RepID=UPI0013FDB900|nr:hypothetical protein [Holospora curviuscula]